MLVDVYIGSVDTGGLFGLLLISSFLLDEVLGCVFANSVDVTDFVLELDSVALVSHLY